MPTYHLLSLLSVGSFFLWYGSDKQSQKRKELQEILFQLLGKYQRKSLFFHWMITWRVWIFRPTGCLSLWLTATSTLALKTLNIIQWNLTGDIYSKSLSNFTFSSGRSKNQDGRHGLWLPEASSTFPLQLPYRIQWNMTGSKYSTSIPSLCFSGWFENQRSRLGVWFAETFSTSPLQPWHGIQRNLIGDKHSTSSSKFVFFELIYISMCFIPK